MSINTLFSSWCTKLLHVSPPMLFLSHHLIYVVLESAVVQFMGQLSKVSWGKALTPRIVAVIAEWLREICLGGEVNCFIMDPID